ncbi:MAG: DUF1295 domain-containing protein [Ignisphaera sp.]
MGYRKELILALFLSILFTIALLYTISEVTLILDKVLQRYFPEAYWDPEERNKILNILRPIGYTAFVVTVALILLGFALKKGLISLAGSLAMYLPIFGYFAGAMFILTGLGALRALWLPILDYSPKLLKLGCIVYLPLTFGRISLISTFLMFVGIFIFVLGSTTWLYGKFKGCTVIDFWIYRYSRHPQYLGFIIWSYGLLIEVSIRGYIKGAFTTPPAIIWLISTDVVIGIAMMEEIEMVKKYGEKYEEYRRKTPFLIPLPKPLAKAVTMPMKLLGGYPPKNLKSVTLTILLYTLITIAVSWPLLVLNLC